MVSNRTIFVGALVMAIAVAAISVRVREDRPQPTSTSPQHAVVDSNSPPERVPHLQGARPSPAEFITRHADREASQKKLARFIDSLSRRLARRARSHEIDAIVELARNASANTRAVAVELLGHVSPPPRAAVDHVSSLARSDPDPSVRALALATLGVWMRHENTLRAELAETVVESVDAAEEPEVRGQGIQVLALVQPLEDMSPHVVEAMRGYVLDDPDAQNRSIAALAFGSAGASMTDLARATLDEALASESDVDVRRLLLTQIMRLTRGDAARSLSPEGVGADLAADLRDFAEIVASGVDDPDQLIEAKSTRDAENGRIPFGLGDEAS